MGPDHCVDEKDGITPNVVRALLRIAADRGVPLAPLCRGVGFRLNDLLNSDIRMSYEQTRRLIFRVLQQLDDPALGIATGACQTPASWGLVGLGLLTCKTLGEAVLFGLRYQIEAGALVRHTIEEQQRTISVEVAPAYEDPPIEAFLVEQSLASALSIGRHLAGASLCPIRVELSFPATMDHKALHRFFRCPISFGRPRSRMVFDKKWFHFQLHGYDPLSSPRLQKAMVESLPSEYRGKLLSSLTQMLSRETYEKSTQKDLAADLNMSQRTMRRRLSELGTSYREMLKETRRNRAIELINTTNMTVLEVSEELGYSDVRSFRRAFRQWTGMLPSQYQKVISKKR